MLVPEDPLVWCFETSMLLLFVIAAPSRGLLKCTLSGTLQRSKLPCFAIPSAFALYVTVKKYMFSNGMQSPKHCVGQ